MAEIRVARDDSSFATPGAHDAKSWVEVLARVGYAAKGVVYIVIGVLAVRAAMGTGGATTSSRGALAVIGDGTFGKIALVVIATGLLGYALWRIIAAFKDTENKGSDAKGIAVRIGQAGRALLYGALGVSAIRLLTQANAAASGSGDNTEQLTAQGLSSPLGKWVVIAAGAGVAAYAIYQMYRAIAKSVRKRMDLADTDPRVAEWIERFGRFGIGARAVVFGIIGWLLVRAGINYDPGTAAGLGESLDVIARGPYGAVLLAVVAAGLVAYGLFQFANARYRHIHVG